MKLNHSLVSIALMNFFLAGCGGGGGEAGEVSVITSQDAITFPDAEVAESVEAGSTIFATDPLHIAKLEKALIEKYLKSADDGSRSFFMMIKDLGGFTAFDQLIATKDRAKIENVLSRYGIGYSTEEPGSGRSTKLSAVPVQPLNVDDCIKFYPASDRNKTFTFGPHVVHIDSSGRPDYATWYGDPATPVIPGTRKECSTTVGKWGVPTDIGGHMIPAALGGWGGRPNIIPQDSTLNQTAWRSIEYVPTTCRKKLATIYKVTAIYASPLDIRPTYLDAMTNVILFTMPVTIAIAHIPNTAPTPPAIVGAQNFKMAATTHCQ